MNKEVKAVLGEIGIAKGQTVPKETVELIEATLTWMRKWRPVAANTHPRNEYVLVSVDGLSISALLAYCDDKGIWRPANGGGPFNRQDLVCFWRPL